MSDQIIDAAMAQALHSDACRAHALVGWIVMSDPPGQAGKVVERQPEDPPAVVEVWFAA